MNRRALTLAAAVTLAGIAGTACGPPQLPPPVQHFPCVQTADRLVSNRCIQWVRLAPDPAAGTIVIGPASEGYFHASHTPPTARILKDPA